MPGLEPEHKRWAFDILPSSLSVNADTTENYVKDDKSGDRLNCHLPLNPLN